MIQLRRRDSLGVDVVGVNRVKRPGRPRHPSPLSRALRRPRGGFALRYRFPLGSVILRRRVCGSNRVEKCIRLISGSATEDLSHVLGPPSDQPWRCLRFERPTVDRARMGPATADNTRQSLAVSRAEMIPSPLAPFLAKDIPQRDPACRFYISRLRGGSRRDPPRELTHEPVRLGQVSDISRRWTRRDGSGFVPRRGPSRLFLPHGSE